MSDLFVPLLISRSESEGFFINPNGLIFCNNGRKHIDFIFNHYEIFNLTKKYLQNIYLEYKEPMGFEGKARVEIIRNLIYLNWVHIRFHHKSGKWVFNCFSFNKADGNIINFIKIFLKYGYACYNDVFEINIIFDNNVEVKRFYLDLKKYL
ncbi:MAG: hypothetical protein M0R46_09560 [Candidatus Muirbacterium halophilum]|nr:hypothetical protein [Candidatus Muirbacterium halophilum]MCK9476155.1 hypothetical protein [Candidatus Muirbacterium halophilum]